MFEQIKKEKSFQSSPRQSSSSCESSTERMNRAQMNHQQQNPFPEQATQFKANSFYTQDYPLEVAEEQTSKQKKGNNNQQQDRRLKAAVSQIVHANEDEEDDDIDQVELGESALKKSSVIPPPVPHGSYADGKRQVKDITTFLKNANIFLDEELIIKCTTSQILPRNDDSVNASLEIQHFDIQQSSPLINGRNNIKEKSPIKTDDLFGRQILSEYIQQEREVFSQAINVVPANIAATITAGCGIGGAGAFQYTNSIYSLGSSENDSSVQTQQNKTNQTLKQTPIIDSLNSFSSIQMNSVENSKGSSNQSIKLENNVKEEEFKNKIGLESLSILRSEVNQFLGLLQNYNNEILQSPKHQQLLQQRLQIPSEENIQESLRYSSEKLKSDVDLGLKQERITNQKWKEDYNQRLEQYLDDDKDMSEFYLSGKQLLDSQPKRGDNLQSIDFSIEQINGEKLKDCQDKIIRQKLLMNNKTNNNQSSEDIEQYNGQECEDTEIKEFKIPYVNNYCNQDESTSSYNDYDDESLHLSQQQQQQQLQQSHDSYLNNQQNQQSHSQYRAQNKRICTQTNHNNLSIIFSESEKSSPQLKQSIESSQSQQNSLISQNSNKDITDYDIAEKQIEQNQQLDIHNSAYQQSQSYKQKYSDDSDPQSDSNYLLQIFDQKKRNDLCKYSLNSSVSQQQNIMTTQSNEILQQQLSNDLHTTNSNKDKLLLQKNKLFSLDCKDFDGIAEELVKHSEYLQQQINIAQNASHHSKTSPITLFPEKQEKSKSVMSNDSCNTSVNLDFSKKSDTNDSLLYLKEAFQLCLQDLKSTLDNDTFVSIDQKLKSVQLAYHSHIQLEIERAHILEKKNDNLNKSNEMIVQALQATKEEIKQLIQNYHLLSEDHNELLKANTDLIQKEKKYANYLEKTEKERQHLKYLILVANEKYEKTDEKCNALVKKNSVLNEQISTMQNQFSNINQILREVIIKLQETKDSESHHILQQILKALTYFITKETNELMNKKEQESQYSRFSHYSPNTSCSAKQQIARENSHGKVQKTRSSSPIRDEISPSTKNNTLSSINNSYVNNNLKSKDKLSSQQGGGTVFQNISTNQTANTKKFGGTSTQSLSKNRSQQVQSQQLNQSLGSIKSKENINRLKTPPKVIQKQVLPARSKEDQRKIEETYRQIFLKQLKQAKTKENN